MPKNSNRLTDRELLKKSLGLLASFNRVVRKRRNLEQATGYPATYGEDAEILHASRLFLSSIQVRPVVKEIVKEFAEKRSARGK